MTTPLDSLLLSTAFDGVNASLAKLTTINQLQMATITVAGDVSCMGVFASDGVAGNVSTNVPLISLIGHLGVGARVLVLSIPTGGNYVIGPGRCCNQETINVSMDAGATNSGGGFTDITGVLVNFSKKFADTALKVTLLASSFSTAINTALEACVTVDGVDYVLAEFVHNPTLTHGSWHGVRDDVGVGLAVATYSVQARWNRVVGVGTLTMDGFNRISLTVEEVPAP